MKETFYWFKFCMSFHTYYVGISYNYYITIFLGAQNEAHGLNSGPTIMMNCQKSAEFKPGLNYGTPRCNSEFNFMILKEM